MYILALVVAAVAVLLMMSQSETTGGLLPLRGRRRGVAARLLRLFPRRPPRRRSSVTDDDSTTACPSAPLRIGILGASAIARHAVVIPASHMDPCAVVVAAVSARDPDRATRYARRNGIDVVYETYDDLIRSDVVDAVYVGLPTAYHCQYALRALREGKHVLLEKPATVSEREARELTAAAEEAGGDVVLFEAFHYRFHPLFRRIAEVVKSGNIGKVRRYDVTIIMPSPWPVLRSWVLGTSKREATTDHEQLKMLDRWCYGLDAILTLAGSDADVTVQDASLDASTANITMEISYGEDPFPVQANIFATKERLGLNWDLKVYGDRGAIEVTNFWFPSVYHSLRIEQRGTDAIRTSVEQHYGEGDDFGVTTFEWQLRQFVRACSEANSERKGRVAIGTKNMGVVDDIFERAGVHDLALSGEEFERTKQDSEK